jgi:cytochrome P450
MSRRSLEEKMTVTPSTRPESAIDFSDPEVNRDPFPYFEQTRALGPAVWNSASGAWLVTSFDDVKSVFSNFADFAQEAAMFEEIWGVVSLPGLDNPRHNEVRSVLASRVSRVAMDGYTGLAQEVIDEHLNPVFERMRAGDAVDVAGLYTNISTQFIARLLGVPTEDCPQFVAWAKDMAKVFDLTFSTDVENAEAVRAAAAKATGEINAYADSALQQRRRAGESADLLGAIATTEVPLSPEEAQGYVVMLIQGGQDTTATWMKNATIALAQHPEQRRAVAEDRALLRQTLDEVIRWQPPVMADIRIVRKPGVEIRGVPVDQGDYVMPVIAAAHRDPTRWENPDAFDIFRPEKGNVGFGFGVHNCLGVNIARRLVTSVINTLLDQVPEYKLALTPEEFVFGRSYAIRGVEQLPLSL